jgi:proline racemase
MCGHAIIALTKLVFDTKMIEKPEGALTIEVPSGMIRSRAIRENGAVEKVSFFECAIFFISQRSESRN